MTTFPNILYATIYLVLSVSTIFTYCFYKFLKNMYEVKALEKQVRKLVSSNHESLSKQNDLKN